MVSFFGLKLGGKKSKQDKAAKHDANAADANAADLSHNFSRPQRMSRPGTSYSTAGGPTKWNAPYMGGAASSSMVELAAPSKRRPSMSSLRHAGSDANLQNPRISVFPALFSGSSGSRPGTPSRPGTTGSRKKDWVNPLDVHFGKGMSATAPAPASASTPVSTETTAAVQKSPLGQFEFGLPGASINGRIDSPSPSLSASTTTTKQSPVANIGQTTSPNGYPSPPLSINSEKSVFAPSTTDRPSSSRRNAPSALRKVDTAHQSSPPSPTASDQHSSSSRSDDLLAPADVVAAAPVIRNVQAKRDTMWYHTPRRRSFTMEVEAGELQRRREEKKRLDEAGFAGNFSAFDFGETVRRPSVDTERGVSPTGQKKGAKNVDVTESPLALSKQTSNSDRTESSVAESIESPMDWWAQNSSSRERAGSSVSRMKPTMDKTESPVDEKKEARARAMTTDQARPTTAVRHPAPLSLGPRRPGPPALSSPADISPGTRPSTDSARPPPRPTRAPPAPLSLTATRTESPSRSPYGPPLDEDSYIRNDAAPRRPSERPPSSPYARAPMEGDFPVMKGLPRGRRPESPFLNPAPVRPSRGDERKDSGDGIGLFGRTDSFDKSSPRRSAMPAPLSPLRSRSPPTWSLSPAPPRLPSPTFASLESSLSFELGRELGLDKPLISPVLSEFGGGSRSGSPMRVEAKKAPPRPAPITLPPSSNDGSKLAQSEFGMRSPVAEKGGFI